MVLDDLTNNFADNAHSIPAEGQILNYVWINPEPFVSSPKARCGVRLHYVDIALQNAKKFPESQVLVWVDYDLLDNESIKILQAHVKGVKNLHICNLQTIEAYKKLQLPEKSGIWPRVDLARFLVLQHCLAEYDVEDVFYSDFDFDDASLNHPAVQANLEQLGMAFCSNAWGSVENQYIGFRRSRYDPDFFSEIIEITSRYILMGGNNGFEPLCEALGYWAERHGEDAISFLLSFNFVSPHRLGYKIPFPDKYDGLCIR